MRFLLVIAIVFFIYQKWGVTDASAELNQKHGSDVIMYSTSWCGYCKKARVMLNMQGVRFKEFDIEKSATANAEMKSIGGHGVPVFLIKGEVVKGFNQKRVLELVKGL
jgi:glutaredoxin